MTVSMLSVVSPAIVIAVAPVTIIIALTLAVSTPSPGAVVGFVAARTLSIGAATVGLVLLASAVSPDATVLRFAASVLELALAVVLTGVAVWACVRRASEVDEPPWLAHVERLGWQAGAAMGLVIWLINPKVVVTVVVTAVVLGTQPAGAGLSLAVVFVLLGSAPVLLIAAARVAAGAHANVVFARVRHWLVAHGWLVLAGVSALVAILLTIDAVGGLNSDV